MAKEDKLTETSYDAEDQGPEETALLSKEEEQNLLRKIDWTIIPFLSLLYLLSFLDRSNIGNARLSGLERDLKMHGLMYNISLAVFFIPFALVEIPSNVIMKRSRPSVYIPCLMLSWGAICTGMGFVKNYGSLLTTRVLLGLVEGGLFPGFAFFISQWYRRKECGLRLSIFFSAATAAGAFGGLFARGLVKLDGKAGLQGWRWPFIVTGAITLTIGFLAFFAMQDYPDRAKFLSETHRRHIVARIALDQDYLATGNDKKYVWQAIKDWKTWVFAVMGICQAVPIYSVSLFLPTIVRDLGYQNTQALLMAVPPYIVACLSCIFGGFAADRMGQRGIFIMAFASVGIIGFLLLLASSNNSVKYAGCFFVTSGAFPLSPQVVAWTSNNFGGSMKRSTSIGVMVMCCNLASLSSAFMYLPKMAPKYRIGHLVLMAMFCVQGTLALFMRRYFKRENARREAIKPAASYTVFEKQQQSERGEHADFFRFII